MDKLPNWLRWILFFPISLLTIIIVYPIINILSNIFAVSEYGIFDEIWAVIMGSGLTGFCFVYFGSLTAPKYQMIVAIVLTAIYGIVCGMLLTSKLFLGMIASSSWFEVISTVIVGILGSIIACYQIYEKKGFEIGEKETNHLGY